MTVPRKKVVRYFRMFYMFLMSRKQNYFHSVLLQRDQTQMLTDINYAKHCIFTKKKCRYGVKQTPELAEADTEESLNNNAGRHLPEGGVRYRHGDSVVMVSV